MSVIPLPNKANTDRFRVYCNGRNPEYFSARKYGSLKKAEDAARKRDLELNPPVETTDMNRLFNEDGLIRGVTRKLKPGNNAPIDAFVCTIYNSVTKKVTKSFTIHTKNKTFGNAYREVQDVLLKIRKIKRTPEIAKAFSDCADYYKVNQDKLKLDKKAEFEKLLISGKLI